MDFISLFLIIPELIEKKFGYYNNLFITNKFLNYNFNFSTLKYLTIGKSYFNQGCKCIFYVWTPAIKNIKLYIILCSSVNEYMLCTFDHLRWILRNMKYRWDLALIYPYTGPKSLLYYNVCNYNFVCISGKKIEKSTSKYICDASDLLNNKYSINEMIKIASILNLDFSKCQTKHQLKRLIYNQM